MKEKIVAKGQVWVTDFIISVVIFFGIIVILIFAWNNTINQNQEQIDFNIIENTALSVSDSLVRTPGIPKDWNEDTLISLGLAISENILNKTKVQKMLNIPDSKIKSSLGISGLEFYMELKYLNGTIIELSGNPVVKGTSPASTASIVVPVERYVIYDGFPSKFVFILWRQ